MDGIARKFSDVLNREVTYSDVSPKDWEQMPASTRVRAAESILSHTAKAIVIEDIEARVTVLERAGEAHKRT